MAFAALSSLSKTLEQIVDVDEWEVDFIEVQKVKYLQGNISFLQTFLEEYSQDGSEREMVYGLERRMRNAAYQAIDIIEYYVSELLLLKSTGYRRWRLTKRLMRLWHHGRGSCSKDLQVVLEEIDSVVEEVMMFMNRSRVGDLQLASSSLSSDGSSRRAPGKKLRIVGLDDDVMDLKARLCGGSSKLQVISVVGMGGMGKTTLSKNVYDDQNIECHFDKLGWATVSQSHHARGILLSLLDSMKLLDDDMLQVSDEKKLREHLYRSLKGRRFLIVMDDVWDKEAWDALRIYFPDDCNGSRILMTTRLLEIAVYAESCSPIHHMHFLDTYQSWILFVELVFSGEGCPPELEEIGKNLAQSCKGLPLAITLLAGVIAQHKTDVDHWQKIRENFTDNLNAAANAGGEQLSRILSLSYHHLPHRLRACFLYIGVFPEDFEIPVSKLTKLWIAEGFLEPEKHRRLEKIAEECVNDLAYRNLILVQERKYDGKIKSCGIHDILRDLCLKKAKEENFLHHFTESHSQHWIKARRLIVHVNAMDEDEDEYEVTDVSEFAARSLLYFCTYGSSLSFFHMNFRLLKVLDAARVYFGELPVDVVELIHLRYLAFTHNVRGYHTFPASISRLRNLQMLIVHRGPMLRPFIDAFYLPVQVWEMPQIRHISLFYTGFLSDPSSRIINTKSAVLENLQTLENVTNFTFTKKAIRMMRKLKKLCVVYGAVTLTQGSDYGLNNLVHLHCLEKLYLSYRRPVPCNVPTPVHFAFPRGLRKLKLSGCQFPWNHMTVIGSLPDLQVLKIMSEAFIGKEWKPVEGEFLKLVYLFISSTELECWKAESTHFPRLKRLSIEHCSKLQGIPIDIGEIETLELIELRYCNTRTVDSAREILEEQHNFGNDNFNVRVYY